MFVLYGDSLTEPGRGVRKTVALAKKKSVKLFLALTAGVSGAG